MSDYKPSHPWYYVLGGAVLKPSQIRDNVKTSGYQGYLKDDIEKAASKNEPQRSITLRSLMQKSRNELFADLSIYRKCARQLYQYRNQHPNPTNQCEHVHMNLSLKHNHIYNGFAHLLWLDELLSEQPELDLFTSLHGGMNGR